jgi:DNA sulfur modification protein DndD
MKIHKIKLKNFRQFYGEQSIEFSVKQDKNVTLIHAENGFGKTTILNAVLWTLFNQVTKKFENPEKILNFEAEDEGIDFASVDVEFEFNKTHYLISRIFDKRKTTTDKTVLRAYKIEKGHQTIIDAPVTFISSVIPAEMAKYFFFDGEAAEAFSSATNYKEIGAAIRRILGCDTADTAIADFVEISKQIDKDIGRISGDIDIKRIETNLSDAREELETVNKTKSDIEDDIAIFKAQREEIIEKLRGMEASKQIEEARQDKGKELISAKNQVKDIKQEMLKWIGQKSIHIISRKLSKQTLDFINDASLRGKIPSPYNEEFVKKLLEDEICICERCLKPESPEWKAVASLLKNASNAEMMGRVVRAKARVSDFRERYDDTVEALGQIKKKYTVLFNRISKLEQEIAELGKKIINIPIAEIVELERARIKLGEKIEKENQRIGVLKTRIYELTTTIKELEDDLIKASVKNKTAKYLVMKRTLVVKSIETLKAILNKYEEEARKTLQNEINDILGKVAHRSYMCKLNENFTLELMYADGRPSPKSGGENQLLSLVFIASLVKYAASRIDVENEILKPGTVAPLVLDAPLGQLDENYQESTAKYIPDLAEQVILLLSSGQQSGGKVLSVLEPYIGSEYLLILEDKGKKGSKDELRRVLHGREYIGTLYERPKNMTSIERIN